MCCSILFSTNAFRPINWLHWRKVENRSKVVFYRRRFVGVGLTKSDFGASRLASLDPYPKDSVVAASASFSLGVEHAYISAYLPITLDLGPWTLVLWFEASKME